MVNNIEKVDEARKEVGDNSQLYFEMSEQLVKSYTEDLDNLMESILQDLKEGVKIDDDTLEYYLLNLSTSVYFYGEKLETVGILDDISKMLRQECYNEAYLNIQQESAETKVKRTVAELQSKAEETAKYKTMVNSIYNRVYKQIKFKIDAANDLISTLRKVMNKRINEMNANASYTNTALMRKGSNVDYDE